MYSAKKLNKQGDCIQPWQTLFPILSQAFVPCVVLTVASWPAHRFLKRQVRWSGIPVSLRIFHSLLQYTQSKALSVVSEAEVGVFLELSCFFCDPADVASLISGSSAFSKSSLCILVHVLLKPSLKDVEHYLASMWNEYSCAVDSAFFGIALLWDWNYTMVILICQKNNSLLHIKLY